MIRLAQAGSYLALFCALFFTMACAASASETAPADVIAFTHVTVVPMDSERVVENQTVIVEGDRIVAVGDADDVKVPEGAVVIDGSGKFLMPGLAEMHGHIPPPNAPAAFTESVLFLYVANGITTVRGMLGWPNQLDLRAKANKGEIVAPTLYLAGPSFNGNSINSPEEAVAKVEEQKEEGWDLLKVHPGLTVAEYDAMARTANDLGIRFGGHVPADVGLLHALEMNQETFDHLDGYVEYLSEFDENAVDEAALEDIVRRSKEAGAWVVPTMALWELLYGTIDLKTVQGYDELKYMPPDQVQQWVNAHRQRLSSLDRDPVAAQHVIDVRMQVLRALNEGGVPILMGTDAPQQFSVPGFSLHRELKRMEAAGMTPYQIIASGTTNVGRYFATSDAFGTIAEGQRADLLLVNANPLDDVANISQRTGVMVRGRWLSEEAIQARLAEIAAGYANGDS